MRVKVVTVEVRDIHVRALRANGLVSATEPKLALGIELLLSMFTAGIFSTDAEKLDALLVSAGVAPQAGHALRSPPV